MDTNLSGKTAIQVIERMTSLLDILAHTPDSLTLKELARQSGLHPSTAHRILNDMATKRFVDRDESGTYRLGLRLLELGNVVKSRLNIRHIAAGPIRELHRKTRQTVNLSVRQGDEIVYIDQAYQQGSGMQVVRAIGGHVPLHLSSAGKLFLSEEPPQAVQAYAQRTGLRGTTRNSITELARLEQELRHVRASGCARDNEEWEPGVRCIAAAIRDDGGALIAGLSISAPADRLRDAWTTDLVGAAEKISAALGYAAAG
ncbi:MAG: IclR family transcriptional regulator [Burkholderiaceae bacterium]|nr:IclR family transcriptional regulator [Burkholderiaceae bacterium]